MTESVLTAPTDRRGHAAESLRDEVLRRCQAKAENRVCFDCPNRNPTWMSLTYAIWLCLNCSGKHRRMGVHISFVRSCTLDNFTPEQLARMELGGNNAAAEYFRKNGVNSAPDYASKLAEKYKEILNAKVEEAKKVALPPAVAASPEESRRTASRAHHSDGRADDDDEAADVDQLPATASSAAALEVPTPEKIPSSSSTSAPVAVAAADNNVKKTSWPLAFTSSSDVLRAKKLADDIDFDELFAKAQ